MRREKEHVIPCADEPSRNQLIAQSKCNAATAAVEKRLLEACALAKPDRRVGPRQEKPQCARVYDTQRAREAARLSLAFGCLRPQCIGRRFPRHSSIRSENVDQRRRIFLETRTREHELFRA